MNYFCEMMLEDELERKRLSTSGKPEPTKNTVLVLPKLVEPQVIFLFIVRAMQFYISPLNIHCNSSCVYRILFLQDKDSNNYVY